MKITPNGITLTRIGLIPATVAAISTRVDHDHGTLLALVLFSVTALTDGLDGYVARSRGQVTTLGIFLDPLADKLLITAALVTLVELQEVSSWVVVLILSREFAVTGLRLVGASRGEVISAHWLGKLKTFAQIAMVLALIPKDSPEWLGVTLTAAALVLTVGSGVEYFWKGRDLLREAEPADRVAH